MMLPNDETPGKDSRVTLPPRRFLREAWRRRTQRRLLLTLGDRLLKDMGIGRGDADREYAKPCWRA
jgi:uncharacterized protein YjiS (DUF1127 family)